MVHVMVVRPLETSTVSIIVLFTLYVTCPLVTGLLLESVMWVFIVTVWPAWPLTGSTVGLVGVGFTVRFVVLVDVK